MGLFRCFSSKLRAATATIAVRLRLSLVAVTLLLAVAGGLTLLQTGHIISAYQKLNQVALPMLNIALRVEDDLNALTKTLQATANIAQSVDQDAEKHRVEIYVDRLRKNIKMLAAYDVPPDAIEILDERLSATQAAAYEMLDGRDVLRSSQALTTNISDLVAQLSRKSHRIVEGASSDLYRAIWDLLWVLGSTKLFALGTILLMYRNIVERQFTQRIEHLNQAVSAIAAGDLAHSIPVTGQDELSAMANALVVFKDNAVDLLRSNEELEKFAYVAAHDLRAPLRAIADLSTWIAEDAQSKLSAESAAYLTLLQERTDRLDRLLNDLLTYARAGARNPSPQPVHLPSFIREQALNIDPTSAYDVSYLGPDHEIAIALTPLQQVVSNILSNAVLHHDKGTGQITVSAQITSDYLTLKIADDGPGIDRKYQSRIFELFQTLHTRDEVDSSGIGLAIVKKVVEAQRGSLKIQSDPAVEPGTTFEIKLPLEAMDQRSTR